MTTIQLPNNWRPRAYQMPAWGYLERGGKHAELVWHRRSGKDEVALHRTAVAAFERVAGYWYMLPEYNQARKAIWDAINPHTGRKRMDEAFPKEIRKRVRADTMMIEFLNGSTFQVVGSDNPDSLVGSPPAGIVYSEWALSNPDARAYLRPIVRENNGWQVFNTTPRGRNHALRTLTAARADPAAFAQILDATQTGVFTQEELDKELRDYIADFGEDYGRAKFEQEYLCSFDAANLGAILGRWMLRAEKTGRMIGEGCFDPEGAPIEVSADIGFRDTAAWWFWQPRYDGFGLVRYVGESGLEAEDWIVRLKAICAKHGYKLGKVWLPHDAQTRTFAAKRSPLERFAEAFGWDKVEIVPMTSKADRINAARRIIESCWFDREACAAGIDGLCSWAYEYNDETKAFSREPRHDWASHPGDAFSYGAQMLEPRERPKEKSQPRFHAAPQVTFNDLLKRVAERRAEMEN